MRSRLALPHLFSTGTLAALFTISVFGATHGQDSGRAVCVNAADREIGSVYHTAALPGGSVLVSAEKGLYLARVRDGQVTVTRATGAELAPVTATQAIGGGTLIGALNGLHLARDVSGAINVTSVPSDTESVFALHDLPGAGVLVGAAKGVFLAQGAAAGVTVTPVEGDTGRVFEMMPFSPNAVLIAAENGWFIARSTNGKAVLAPAGKADTGYSLASKSLPGIGLLIEAQAGWFLAREQGGAVTVNRFCDATTGIVGAVGDLPSGRMLLHTENGWFTGERAGGNLAFTRVAGGPDAPRVDRMIAVRGGLLFSSEPGWFVAREKDTKVTFTRAGDCRTTSNAFHVHELPSGAVLVGALYGLFVIRPSETSATLAKIDDYETGYIFMMREITGRGLLIGAQRSFFTAHEENGKIHLTPASGDDSSTGRLVDVPRYPGFLAHEPAGRHDPVRGAEGADGGRAEGVRGAIAPPSPRGLRKQPPEP
jgi:hypothetical protein